MDSDMKASITIELTQEDFLLFSEALEEKHHKHMGIYRRTIGSGYGKSSTEEKAKQHLAKAELFLDMQTRLANEFI